MSQKIKKQLKRSMPVFVIVSLLASTMAVGLVFNFNLNFYNPVKKHFDVFLSLPGAQAAPDYASTTVTVKNAPPSISAGPAENPTSTSTSPVNAGGNIGFTVSAHDDESNNYYMAVCKTDSITASTTGGAPSCAASQELCISGKVASDAQNTCTYTNVDGSVGETQAWYVFVCDDHGSEADCSPASQGAGWPTSDGGSPFYINHAPTINVATTSINNVVPGGTFEVTATSTDTDILGGANELTLNICETAVYSTTTGCAVELCTATGTASSPGASTTISCQWTDSAPTPDTDYPYYVYIKDEFGLAGTNNGIQGAYTIINVAPTVSNIKLVPNIGNEIWLNIKDAGGTVISATTTSAQDNNGCADLVSATGTIYWSSAAGEQNCAADDNECYPIASSNCAISGCSGAIAQVTCTTTIEYFAHPSDANSNTPATTWLAGITLWDEALSGTATTSLPGTELHTGEAFEVGETLINYGTLVAGTNSGTSTATTTITNFGNSPIDNEISGDWMTQAPSYVIGEQWQEYSTTTNFQWGGTVSLDLSSTTPGALVGLDNPRPTTTASDEIDYLYWGMGIPPGQFSGTYNGENLFVVKFAPNGNWN